METTKSREPTLREAAADLLSAVQVRRRVHEHPYGALTTAIGVGYVLGGGLFTRLTARLLKAGARVGADLAAAPLLAKAARALVDAQDRGKTSPR